MVHVVQGRVVQKRSLFRLSIIPEVFWGLVNLIGHFFETMFSLEKANAYRQTGRTKTPAQGRGGFGGGGGGGGGGGSGRPGGRPAGGRARITGIKDFKSAGNIPGGS